MLKFRYKAQALTCIRWKTTPFVRQKRLRTLELCILAQWIPLLRRSLNLLSKPICFMSAQLAHKEALFRLKVLS